MKPPLLIFSVVLGAVCVFGYIATSEPMNADMQSFWRGIYRGGLLVACISLVVGLGIGADRSDESESA